MPKQPSGYLANYIAVKAAYDAASPNRRDDMAIGDLMALVVRDLTHPPCTWAEPGKVCVQPGELRDGRALCPMHRAMVHEARAQRRLFASTT